MKFEGVYVALASPFSDNYELDYQTLERLIDFLFQNDVNGLVPCATTGEGPTLSDKEREKIISISVEKSKGRPVIAGCGSNSTQKVIELCKESHSLGAKAALVVTPYYNKPTVSGLIAHYQKIADLSPIPIILYNVPSRTNVRIDSETVSILLKHENIIGIKEAGGDYSEWLRISNNVDLTKKFFLAGDDDALAFILSLGGSGIISASANVVPKIFVDIYNAFLNNEIKKAFHLQKKLVGLKKALFLETNPSPIKYALSVLGFGTGKVRLPLVEVKKETREIILKELKGYYDL